MDDLPQKSFDDKLDEFAAAAIAVHEEEEQWKASLPAKLEELREQWERSGRTHVPTLFAALNMVEGILPPPPWLVAGLNEVMMKQMRPTLWKKDEKRWLLVQYLHFDLGLSWIKSYKRASEILAGTDEEGKPDTMRKGYMAYDAILKKKGQQAGAIARFPREERVMAYSNRPT